MGLKKERKEKGIYTDHAQTSHNFLKSNPGIIKVYRRSQALWSMPILPPSQAAHRRIGWALELFKAVLGNIARPPPHYLSGFKKKKCVCVCTYPEINPCDGYWKVIVQYFFYLFIYFLIFWDRVSLCSPGCTWTHYEANTGLEFAMDKIFQTYTKSLKNNEHPCTHYPT